MNKTILLFFTLISGILISCNSQSIIPELKMGMSEKDWIKAAGEKFHQGINDQYLWNIGKKNMLVTAELNRDGGISLANDTVNTGPLRIITLNLANWELIKSAPTKEPPSIYDTTESIYSLPPVCSLERFDTVLNYLREKYGKEDSTTVETGNKAESKIFDYALSLGSGMMDFITSEEPEVKRIKDSILKGGGIDTINRYYYFSSKASEIVLQRGALKDSSESIPSDHFDYAKLFEFSKNYEKDLYKFIDEYKAFNTPANLLAIPVSGRIQVNNYGKRRIALVGDFSLQQSFRFPEYRSITALMGSFIIIDKYEDTVFRSEPMDIELNDPLSYSNRLGRNHMLGIITPFTTIRQETIISYYVDPAEHLNSALTSIINNNLTFRARFIPSKILFLDGSILKED